MRHVPLAVMTALIVTSGCNNLFPTGPTASLPGGTGTKLGSAQTKNSAIVGRIDAGVKKPIRYDNRDARVAVMTQSFSFSNNPKLKKASESFNAFARSLGGLLTPASSAWAGGGLVANGGGYWNTNEFAASIRNLRVMSVKNAYAIAGIQELKQGEATVLMDDATKELTGVKTRDAELRFNFVKAGNRRTWTIDIVKSPDGTRGKVTIDVNSTTWRSFEWPVAYMPPEVCDTDDTQTVPRSVPKPAATPWNLRPSPVPIAAASPANPDDWDTTTEADDEVPDGEPETEPTPDMNRAYDGTDGDPDADWMSNDDDAQGYCRPDSNWVRPTPVPFRVGGNEYPEFVERASFQIEVVPKGDDSLKMQFNGTLDEAQNVPNSSVRVPTHWVFAAQVPGIAMDWESRMKLIPRNFSFDGKGRMLVQMAEGEEAFTYTASTDESRGTGTFALTNQGAKMQLLMTTGGWGAAQTRLLSTEDGAELGTVTMIRSNAALLTFKDGTTKEWELFPGELLSVGAPTAPRPEQMAPQRYPVARRPVPINN